LARVAVKHRCLGTGWQGGWRRSPFDVLGRDHLMLASLLTNGAASQRCEYDRRHRSNVEKDVPFHCDFSLDVSTSGCEGAHGWWKVSNKMVQLRRPPTAMSLPTRPAEFSAQRLQRSRPQSIRPCDCEKEHWLHNRRESTGNGPIRVIRDRCGRSCRPV